MIDEIATTHFGGDVSPPASASLAVLGTPLSGVAPG